jgi:predicted phage terminase large subunit-like protein
MALATRRLRDIEEGRQYEESLYAFLTKGWPYIDPAEFVGGWHLEAIAEHLEAVTRGHIKRLLINIPPRMSKPVSRNAIITCKNKGLIPLGEIVVGDEVLTHKGRWRRVTEIHPQGVISAVRLTTKRGRIIEAAPDHPFLTPEGWLPVGKLKPDDVVGIVPCRDECGQNTISIQESRLLGYLVGDGSCQGTPNITCADDIEAADIEACVRALGFTPTGQSYHVASSGYRLRRIAITAPHNEKVRRRKGYVGLVKQWLITHGLESKNSYNKRVPQAVMRGTNEVVCAFIGAYWACDGYISPRGVKRSGVSRDDLGIGCDSVSHALLMDLQLLLTRLGISSSVGQKIAKIKTKKQGDTYTSYKLILNTQDDCWRFASLIEMAHAKNAKLVEARKRRFDFDRPIWGDVVASVEEAAPTDCICLTVDEDHSFVANGFAVHNSSIVSVAWPAWVWLQKPNSYLEGPQVQFMYASYAESLAVRDSIKTRRLIESPWYQKHWGNRFSLTEDQNTKIKFENNFKGYRFCTSVGGTVTGEGGACFPDGTKISTPNGFVNIENIKAGDTILAFDHSQGKVVNFWVEATQIRYRKEFCELHLSSGRSVRCTSDHPIFAAGRGYVPAGSLGRGDRLIEQEWACGFDAFEVCQLFQSSRQAAVRGSQVAQDALSGCLLQCTLSRSPLFPQMHKNKGVRGLWADNTAQTRKILQRIMCDFGARIAKARQGLSAVWDFVQESSQHLLQPRMRQYRAFCTDARFSKFQFQRLGEIFQSIQRDGEADSGARWAQVYGLWLNRWSDQKSHQGHPFSPACSSHRRGHQEQHPTQPDSVVHGMPQEAPSWHFVEVTGVSRYGCASERVHDLQVARCHNFFADGVLVHNCLVIDDGHKADEVESDTMRESVINWYDEVFYTRRNNPKLSAIVVIGQRVHGDDISNHLIESGEFTQLILPMEYESDRKCVTVLKKEPDGSEITWEDPRTNEGDMLCEGRYGEEEIKEQKKKAFVWAGQFQQRPAPKGGAIIKGEWWKLWDRPKYPPFEYLLASLDTAYTEKQQNDPSAMTIWGIFRDEGNNPKVMLVYAWQDWLEFPELCQKVLDICTRDKRELNHPRFPVDRIIVEGKASGLSIVQELSKMMRHRIPVESINYNKGKHTPDKTARMYSVQHLFTDNMIWAPDRKFADTVIEQCEIFPNGQHDDIPDTVSMALRYFRDCGFALMREEYAHEIVDELTLKPRQGALYPV